MKKIIFIFVVLLFSSCLGTKKIVEKSKETTSIEKNNIKKDSSNVVERNKAIKDQLTTSVPKSDTSDEEFNKRVDKEVDRILSKLNTRKTSGSNSYVSRYDKETRQLIVDFIVAQTETKLTETNKENSTEKTFEQKTNEYYKKVITTMPWYLWVLAYFVFLDGKVVSILANFIPGLKGATSILSLLNFSNKSS